MTGYFRCQYRTVAGWNMWCGTDFTIGKLEAVVFKSGVHVTVGLRESRTGSYRV